MKILYVAYSCLPEKGSEEKIGWNVPIESAKTNEVIVVTKEEHRGVIEKYIAQHNLENPKFYFVDIPKVHKKLWKGAAYSIRLNIWHKKALPVVRQICKAEGVDLIHQITPIEFRSIGAYYKIPNTRFVCGPLGGGEYIPRGLNKYALSNMHIEIIRGVLNWFYRTKFSLSKQLHRCDWFLFANRETKQYMQKLIGQVSGELYFDNGVSREEITPSEKSAENAAEMLTFLVAGRMAYRKGHRLLIDAIRRLPQNCNCRFRFVGTGPEEGRLKKLCKKYQLQDRVTFTGRISFTQMKQEYAQADVFVMPSIRETTGAVLLEAASNGIPVIAIDHFGAPVLYDENAAYFFTGHCTDEYISSLEKVILDCINNPSELRRKAQNAAQVVQMQTWEKKVEKYNQIYAELRKQ